MRKVRLGDVCKVQGGYAFKSSDFKDSGVPIVRIGNIQEDKVKLDNDICYEEEFLASHKEFEVKKNDILATLYTNKNINLTKDDINCFEIL